MLDRKERRDFIVLEDDLALRVEDKAHVKKTVGPVGMARLCLCYDEGVVLAGHCPERLGLFAWNVDGAFPGKLRVIEVQDFVIKGLQGAFGEGDKPNRQIQA